MLLLMKTIITIGDFNLVQIKQLNCRIHTYIEFFHTMQIRDICICKGQTKCIVVR